MKRVSDIHNDLSHIDDRYLVTTCGRIIETRGDGFIFGKVYSGENNPKVKLENIYGGNESLSLRKLVGRAFIDNRCSRYVTIGNSESSSIFNIKPLKKKFPAIRENVLLSIVIPKGAYMYYPDKDFKTVAFYGKQIGKLLGVADISSFNKGDILNYLMRSCTDR
ncbi:MAG: hypothetical protein ACRC5T_04170 [Cetobacterium sp.]